MLVWAILNRPTFKANVCVVAIIINRNVYVYFAYQGFRSNIFGSKGKRLLWAANQILVGATTMNIARS